ncbi:MAG: alpha-ketoglutarate-dependent dioxygenase AlkB [Spirulina sp. SIO3F2]|nr:alpha-ketoglutarate-dependent dioxygenase AlkB [Spirulina sp. SIO3F2]
MNVLQPQILLIDDFLANHQQFYTTLRTTVNWDTRMAARQTASFGEPYQYSQMTYPATVMHPSLLPVADALQTKLKIRFNNCLLNFYPFGESTMGFHSDDTTQLQPGTGVAIVSLGHAREITYRAKADKTVQHSFLLIPGSLLYMDSAVQADWLHAIRKQPGAGPRISLTWRALKRLTTPVKC